MSLSNHLQLVHCHVTFCGAARAAVTIATTIATTNKHDKTSRQLQLQSAAKAINLSLISEFLSLTIQQVLLRNANLF